MEFNNKMPKKNQHSKEGLHIEWISLDQSTLQQREKKKGNFVGVWYIRSYQIRRPPFYGLKDKISTLHLMEEKNAKKKMDKSIRFCSRGIISQQCANGIKPK